MEAYQMPDSAAEQSRELSEFFAADRVTRGPNDGLLLDGMPIIQSDSARAQIAAAKDKRARKARRSW